MVENLKFSFWPSEILLGKASRKNVKLELLGEVGLRGPGGFQRPNLVWNKSATYRLPKEGFKN